MSIKQLFVTIVLGLALSQAQAVTVSTSTSSDAVMEDFSTLPTGESSFFDGNGVSVAEHFFGQTVNDPGGSGFETVSGSPSGPLALTTTNGGIWDIQGVAGLAGGSSGSDIGEGIVSFLFDYDIFSFGTLIGGTNGGSATFDFFARDGSIIDSILFGVTNTDFTFSSSVAFAGVTMSNTDPAGIAYDNIRFAAASVPEASSMVLFGLGLLGMGFMRRRNYK